MRKWVAIWIAILLIAAGGFFLIVPAQVGQRMNQTIQGSRAAVSERARALHRTLFVADLHADTLLWSRDLLDRGSWGHVDLPRLIEGNVAWQNFTVVTKTPRGMNIENNDAGSDNITLLAIAERWPIATWNSLLERALYQARRLHEAAARSNGQLMVIRTKEDVRTFLERRKSNPTLVAGMLGLEGSHALEGQAANLDRLYDAGYRMIGITHFFDNEMGGSAHGSTKPGLTPEGRELVKKLQAKNVFIDLAHASPKVIDEVLAMATRPVIVSHTGVKGTCDNTRNLSDEQLKGIARTGGIVGIGYWDTAVCGRDAQAIARAIKYTVDLIGPERVALGSDYDGAVEAPFDTAGLAQITEALLKEGLSEGQIRLVMGENALRIFQYYLP